MRAVVLTIGSELLSGSIQDSNSAWAAAELTARGIEVVLIISVDDSAGAIADGLDIARSRGEVVWVTGGMGSTRDDMTVRVLAGFLGRGLVESGEAAARVRGSYERRGMPLPPGVLGQAMVPEGAEVLENPVGSAPGLLLEDGGTTFVVLPGVPEEMKAMASRFVLPRLSAGHAAAGRVLGITGMPESAVDERIRDIWAGLGPGERFALQVEYGVVKLRILVSGQDRGACEKRMVELEEAVRARLGDVVFGADGGGLEDCVVGFLRSRGFTLALAESVTGGLLAGRLSSVPGASDVLRGGWVAYQEAAKKEWLGIPAGLLEAEGAVSEKTALAMAKAAREKGRADVGLSTTGWAGPGGGTPTDPVGTVFMAVATSRGAEARRMVFRGGRDNIRNFAVTAALTFLRGRLA